MDTFQFNRNLTNHLEELSNVLRCTSKIVPASQVRSEWSCHINMIGQKGAWFAYWKIPRFTCEEYNIRYPTVVFGTVDHILSNELKAIFHVEGDKFALPIGIKVRLEDLWPKKDIENMNIKKIAECIDLLRFFYKNIWMPWDIYNGDDIDWKKMHLESRIRFYYDLKDEVYRPMRSYASRLLKEARYLQKRKEMLEMKLDDKQEDNIEYPKLMQIHLRILIIKNKIELLENPEARTAFLNVDEHRLKSDLTVVPTDTDHPNDNCIFVVTNMNDLDHQLKYLQKIQKIVGNTTFPIKFCNSLQNCLETSKSSNEIYVPTGIHSIKYLEYLSDHGLIHAVCSVENTLEIRVGKEITTQTDAIIKSYDENSLLLMFDSDFIIKNVILDCRNVRQGILIRNGTVRLENCSIIGDRKSSISQGIVLLGGSSVVLINTLIKDFSTGINCLANSSATFDNSLIYGCQIGIDCNESCSFKFNFLEIMNSKMYGMSYTNSNLPNNEKKIIVNDLESIDGKPFTGKCIFQSNAVGNIAMYNKSKIHLNDTFTLMDLDENASFISSGSSIYDDSVAQFTITDWLIK